jgi:protease I
MLALSGCKVAILATDGFEQRRFLEGRGSLREAGASTIVVSSTRDDLICSWNPSGDGYYTAVERHICDVHPAYDALFLPGTVIDPEAVFVDPRAADFVKSFFDLGRPIASLCSDRWLLVHRGSILRGRLTPEPLFASNIVLSQSTSVAGADPGPYEDLDGFIRRMLTFFQVSLAHCARTSISAPQPSIPPGHMVGAPPMTNDAAELR